MGLEVTQSGELLAQSPSPQGEPVSIGNVHADIT
jgi:hypothetical protein